MIMTGVKNFRFIFISVLLTFEFLAVASGRNCDESKLQECLKQGAMLTEDSTLDEMCSAKVTTMNCAKKFVEDCDQTVQADTIEKAMLGVQSFIDQLCSPDSQLAEEYAKHEKCISPMLKQDICPGEIRGRNLQERCCSVYGKLQCKVSVAKAACGPDAGKHLEKVLTIIGGKLLSDGCGRYKSQCMNSAEIHRLPTFGLITSLALLYVASFVHRA